MGINSSPQVGFVSHSNFFSFLTKQVNHHFHTVNIIYTPEGNSKLFEQATIAFNSTTYVSCVTSSSKLRFNCIVTLAIIHDVKNNRKRKPV